MSYALSHIGEAEITTAIPAPVQLSPTVAAATLMFVLAIPWVPVLGLAWAGKKWKGNDGAWVGALTGFTLSTLVLRSAVRKIGS